MRVVGVTSSRDLGNFCPLKPSLLVPVSLTSWRDVCELRWRARAPRKTSEPTADQERDKPVTKAKVGQRSGAERGLGGE